jgi:hypothetical protein
MKKIFSATISVLLLSTITASCSTQTSLMNNQPVDLQLTAQNIKAEPLDPVTEAKCLKILMAIKGEEKDAVLNLGFLKSLYENDKTGISFYSLTEDFSKTFSMLKHYLGNSGKVRDTFKMIYTSIKEKVAAGPSDTGCGGLCSVIEDYRRLLLVNKLNPDDAASLYRIIAEFEPGGSKRYILIKTFEQTVLRLKDNNNPKLIVDAFDTARRNLLPEEMNFQELWWAFDSVMGLLGGEKGDIKEAMLDYNLIGSMLKPGELRVKEAGKIVRLAEDKNTNGAKAREIYSNQKYSLPLYNPNPKGN